ncbi:MAG: peroxiredoxin [Bacteroidota bacterium]
MAVQVGQKAPSFSLVDTYRKERSLDEFKGKNTVLAFFPGAFTGVCTKEMCTFRDSMTNLNELNAQVVGVSVDAPFANKAFATQNNLQFPLLSDYSRKAITTYGLAHENSFGLEGYTASKRAVFVLDKDGIVQYSWVSDNPGVEPNYDEINATLAKL